MTSSARYFSNMSAKADLTAIVVSWNAAGELEECLQSLTASRGLNLKTVVIDNASTEPSVEMVRQRFPTVELIINDTNRGFAAAVNQGLARAVGDVVLINPDLKLEPSTLAVLRQTLSRHPRVGVVGPRLIYPDGKPQPSVKRFPRWIDLFLILTKLPNLFPRLARSYNGFDIDYDREQTVDQVMGSCFMIRRSCLSDVGLFDQGFWIWFEEVDFCKRTRDRGWLTLYTPIATAVHVRGASFKRTSAVVKQRVLRQSIVHYSRKHFGRLSVWLLVPGLLISWLSAQLIDACQLTKPEPAKNF